MISIASMNTNRYFELRGCGNDPAGVSTYKGYRYGYPLNICLTDSGQSYKNVESTTITYNNGVKYISYVSSMYSTSDCSGPSSDDVNVEFMAECPLVPTPTVSAAYVTDCPTSGGSTGSILIKY
jgi:hypothetical protein